VAIWYISWLFGIFFPVSVCCTKKNLASLIGRSTSFELFFDFVHFELFSIVLAKKAEPPDRVSMLKK
jgi:hypothetical protein